MAAPAASAAAPQLSAFDTAVAAILAEPYQPNYVPAGTDSAFLPDAVPNTAPAQDYTSGSIPGSADHPNWPAAFAYVRYLSGDGAPLRARVAVHAGVTRPGVVVAHGFNTNGKESVIRWAAMLYANGYDVIASDQRDFKDEYQPSTPPLASDGYPNWLQTFGWKEAQDVLAAGQYLKAQPGVGSVGLLGFSEGAQNAVLALGNDAGGVFSAGLTFSPPADQNAQVYSTAVPPDCQPPGCSYPATDSLVALVVPPYGSGGKYDDPCQVLNDAAARYQTTPPTILAQERAFRAQQSVTVPLLNFYSQDDSLVQPFHAKMMAGYENGKPLQKTFLVSRGEHAYFFDRWWQQRAILDYFKALLPGASADGAIMVAPTVNQTPGGAAFSTQLVDLGNPTTADADALANKPVVCPAAPTAVTLLSLGARRDRAGVMVRWRTASETGVVGFDVYRADGDRRVRINRRLVAARGSVGLPAAGYAYAVRDRAVSRRSGLRYEVESVRTNGRRSLVGSILAR